MKGSSADATQRQCADIRRLRDAVKVARTWLRNAPECPRGASVFRWRWAGSGALPCLTSGSIRHCCHLRQTCNASEAFARAPMAIAMMWGRLKGVALAARTCFESLSARSCNSWPHLKRPRGRGKGPQGAWRRLTAPFLLCPLALLSLSVVASCYAIFVPASYKSDALQTVEGVRLQSCWTKKPDGTSAGSDDCYCKLLAFSPFASNTRTLKRTDRKERRALGRGFPQRGQGGQSTIAARLEKAKQ